MATNTEKIIRLDEAFYITRDSYSWALTYEAKGEINKATGKPKTTRRQSHHGTLKMALKDYVDQALKACEDWVDVLDRLGEIEELINNLKISHLEAELKSSAPFEEDID